MIYLGYLIQAATVAAIIGGGAWGLSPAPTVEAFTVDRGQLVIA